MTEKKFPRWDVTANVCEEIAALARSKNIPNFFVLLPTDFQIDLNLGRKFALGAGLQLSQVDFDQPGKILNSKFKERGLHLINLTSALRDAFNNGIMTNGRVDRHLSPG